MYATNIFLENMHIPIIRSHDFLGRTRLLKLYINSSSVEEIQPLAFNTLPSLMVCFCFFCQFYKIISKKIFFLKIFEKSEKPPH